MLCIYHIADHDGKGSAAIVKRMFPEIELMGLNHDMEIPFDEIRKHEKIIICDIALPLDFMNELNKDKELIWIDHHVSVIEAYNQMVANGSKEIKGLRRVGIAAMRLTWEYFHPNENEPEGLVLLGLNDLFDLRDKRVRPFEYAFQSLGVNRPEDKTWDNLLDGTININEMVAKGEAILSWIKIRNIRLSHNMAFESEYMGYKCICANMAQGYSEFFDSVPNLESYDFMCNFYMNKKNTWNLSFYSSKDEVDVSKIASSLGGGGHKHAAGASKLKKLPDFLMKN
ncbi:MAG: hypothetical protein E7012_01310 [Alphaproteobacteria bacterium]|nr:hypothetical protein [Alphaproteobacteria bacterium]